MATGREFSTSLASTTIPEAPLPVYGGGRVNEGARWCLTAEGITAYCTCVAK